MRKIALLALAAFMVASLAGCGKKEEKQGISIQKTDSGIEVKTTK